MSKTNDVMTALQDRAEQVLAPYLDGEVEWFEGPEELYVLGGRLKPNKIAAILTYGTDIQAQTSGSASRVTSQIAVTLSLIVSFSIEKRMEKGVIKRLNEAMDAVIEGMDSSTYSYRDYGINSVGIGTADRLVGDLLDYVGRRIPILVNIPRI